MGRYYVTECNSTGRTTLSQAVDGGTTLMTLGPAHGFG